MPIMKLGASAIAIAAVSATAAIAQGREQTILRLNLQRLQQCQVVQRFSEHFPAD